MLNWIKSTLAKKSQPRSVFETAFSSLKHHAKCGDKGAKRAYQLLLQLETSSPKRLTDDLVKAVNEIRYASNTNDFFYFYFPIVSHILYYKPEDEHELLGLLVGPNFANGVDTVEGMIQVIQGAMEFKLKGNPKYLTEQGQHWIENTLPGMKKEVEREIEKCWIELDT